MEPDSPSRTALAIPACRPGPFCFAAGYALLGWAWLWASGHVLGRFVSDPVELETLEQAKGALFIGVTAALLYAWLRAVESIRERLPEVENRLHDSEAQLESFLEFAPDGIVLHDAKQIFYANPAFFELLKMPRTTDLAKLTVRDIVAPEYVPMMNARIVETAAQIGTMEPMEVRFRTVKGTTIELEHASRSMFIGGRILVQSHLRDLTSRNFARQELERWNEDLELRVRERTAQLSEANKALESFTYSVAHDLRSPVGRIGGFATVLLEAVERGDREKLTHFASRIAANTRIMADMIDGLSLLSKADRAPLDCSTFDTHALVANCVSELGDFAAAAVHVGALPSTFGDPKLIRQVWANLVGNALKYSARTATPQVFVSGARGDGACTFCVEDNGIGFDEGQAGRLFETFERLANAQDFAGTGVGLSIVKRIVMRHGGRVWAEGRAGEGARFFFSLPAREA